MFSRVKKLLQSKKFILIAVLIVFIAAGGVLAATRKKSKTPQPSDVIRYSTDHPSEVKPDKKTYQWTGAANEPKFISLPTISTEGFVQKVGVDQHKAIAVPDNIYVAGWFTDYQRPGEPGLSIIDGHVDGHVNVAIFNKLASIKKGEEFFLTLGSGKVLDYKVLDVVTVKESDAVNPLFSQDPTVKSQLNLITCGGKFDAKKVSYDSRVIVSAAVQ